MSLRLRFLLLVVAICGVAGYFLTRSTLEQVRPRYLESMEESLVDTATLLASVLETSSEAGEFNPEGLRRAFAAAQRHDLAARIFTLQKTAVDLRVYVTDDRGKVLFDSTGKSEGQDFSRWNDVYRTLRGQYGARSTRDVDGDDDTQVLYVAAPIKRDGRIIGVLSVGKPARGVNVLVAAAKRKILGGALLGGTLLLAALFVGISWVVTPLERLTAYARAIRDQRTAVLPALPGRTLHELGTAFEEMRDALEGRKQAERHTQALVHEVKTPLAAIRGAAELLQEEMPPEQRRRFLENIRTETGHMQRIVERLFELSTVEAKKALSRPERMQVSELVAETLEFVRPAFEAAGVHLTTAVGADDGTVVGERFLLRQALANLLQNALDFSTAGGRVELRAVREPGRLAFIVEDEGPGVPDYALGRVFERFYSLPRPSSGQKSTGIGLSLVREIARLHGGDASLGNRTDRAGARAVFWISAG
jgi:two-component system sensor histidine kinase CreC